MRKKTLDASRTEGSQIVLYLIFMCHENIQNQISDTLGITPY